MKPGALGLALKEQVFPGRVMSLGLPEEDSVQNKSINWSELKSRLVSIAGSAAHRAASRDTP